MKAKHSLACEQPVLVASVIHDNVRGWQIRGRVAYGLRVSEMVNAQENFKEGENSEDV
jgi:hypothetical protein